MTERAFLAAEPDSPARAVDRLTAAGYTHALAADDSGLHDATTGQSVVPEDLVVDEVMRFEGISDPDDMAIVLAVHDAYGPLRATYATAFGMNATEADAEALRRLPAQRRPEHQRAGSP